MGAKSGGETAVEEDHQPTQEAEASEAWGLLRMDEREFIVSELDLVKEEEDEEVRWWWREWVGDSVGDLPH